MAVTVNFYNNFIEDLGLQRMNLSSDTFKAMLVNGYVFNAAHTSKSQITGELSTANGYTAGGLALLTSWVFSSGVTKFDADDASWTAAGGAIGPATGIVIYDDTVTSPTADRLLCYVDFGLPETAGDGTQFRIIFDANGIFTIG